MKDLIDQETILKDIENCTFKPAINTSFNKHALGSMSKHNQIDVYERNEQWQKVKEHKILQIKSQREQEDSEE